MSDYKHKDKSFNLKLEHKRAEISVRMQYFRSNLEALGDGVQEHLLHLTKLDLSEIQRRLADGSLQPVDLLHAYQLKALELYETGNSGLCEFIREAGDFLPVSASTTNVNDHSPLFGVPVSVKEILPVAGYDCTLGLIKFCENEEKHDCVIVQALKEEGAIPFAITATTQYCRVVSGFNPVFKEMNHPKSDHHEPGGSSCGEAILLAKHGSPLGFGTDLDGSVRIPAAFCGIAGLKPTSNRLSAKGLVNFDPNSYILLAHVPGPMARKVKDLVSAMRTLLRPSMFKLDSSVPPLPFQEALYTGQDRLKIGYYDSLVDERVVPAVPAVRNALQLAVVNLKNRGHTLIRFNPPTPFEALDLALHALLLDGGKSAKNLLAGEPLSGQVKAFIDAVNSQKWVRNFKDSKSRRGDGKPAALLHTFNEPKKSTDLMWLLNSMYDYRKRFTKAVKESGDLDLIICPTWPCPALPKSMHPTSLSPCWIYAILYNLLDLPAGTVPYGVVSQSDLDETAKNVEQYKCNGNRYLREFFRLQSTSLGLPLSVQVVGRPYREEVVLRVMEELEQDMIDK